MASDLITSSDDSVGGRPSVRRRLCAAVALLAPIAAVAVLAVGLRGDVGRAVVAVLLVLVMVLAAWYAITRTGSARYTAAALFVVAVVAVVVLLLTGEHHGLVLVAVVALISLSLTATPIALTPDAATTRTPAGEPAEPATSPVLIINLKSGGGKAESHGLADEARSRGIEPVVLQPGDDLRQLAVDAIEGGADVIGMAGGDGSQALVASVAADHDVAHVCIPSGTRNHFALDVGLDRNDVLGALDAFGEAIERRIDLATVNGRVFVNNVSLGVYAKIVQSPEYRDAKRQTTTAMLPDLLGPDAEPFDIHFEGPDGRTHDGAQVVQVSNNPYVLTRLIGGSGTRARVDTGTLGIAAVHLTRDSDVARFVALESAGRLSRFEGWLEWATPTFEVRSGNPVEAGVDGEALLLEPPLRFASRHGAVRIRIPIHAPGSSPAARSTGSAGNAARALLSVLRGRPDAAT